MKNLLNDQGPLPDLKGCGQVWTLMGARGSKVFQPMSKRHEAEEEKQYQKERGEDWKPYSPGLEINGKGQLRTKDYKPPEPPEVDLPVVFYSDCSDWVPLTREMLKTVFIPYPEETQPDTRTAEESKKGEWNPEWDKHPGMAYWDAIRDESGKIVEWKTRETPWKPKEPVWPFPVVPLFTSDGWIPHKPGDPMPCDPEMRVTVKWECTNKETKIPGCKMAHYWHNHGKEISAWKPAT